MTNDLISEFARLGVATVYEAGGRTGLIDLSCTRLSQAAGWLGRRAQYAAGRTTT